ncbi:MAG: tetratricopeptide repeat protein [Planctomycetota bacterium]
MRATTSFVTRIGACLVAALAALAGAGGPARADGADVEEAKRLRDASAEDWNAQRYADAAAKLRRALAIYAAAPDRFRDDLAVTRRALVWNLVKSGDLEAAFAPFDALLVAGRSEPTVRRELFTAYGALWEAARDAGSLEGAHQVLDRVRLRASAERDAGVASQVLHDLASIARDRGAPDEALRLLEQAVTERRDAKASTELAWSLNNLANLHLAEGRLDAALAPLLEAQRLVLEQGAISPQAAVGVNTRTVLDRLAGGETPTAARRAWVWDMAEVAAASEVATVHRPEVLLRAALRLDAKAGGPSERLASARRLAKLVVTPTAAPVEIRADLLLHAATVAIGAGGATDALGWLASVDVGTGPAAGHLAARRGVAVALARAAQQQGGETTAAVEEARGALKALGDRGLREASLDALVVAADRAGLTSLAGSMREELAASKRDGQPGARGASAMSGGDVAKFRELGPHDPVFELRAVGIRLRVTDLLTQTVVELDGTWQPQAVAVHGLTLKGFGAYVRLDGFAYGEAAAASNGGPTTLTLDAVEPYLVVPAATPLRILKNGAVTYAP